MFKLTTTNQLRKSVQSAILFPFILIVLLNSGCHAGYNSQVNDKNPEKVSEGIETDDYMEDVKMKPFMNSDSTFGFTIFRNGRIYIHQAVIPVPGSVKGFTTESDAMRVAEIVVKKIKNHISPEIANEKELDSLGIIKSNISIK